METNRMLLRSHRRGSCDRGAHDGGPALHVSASI